jgi:hypothetical protein
LAIGERQPPPSWTNAHTSPPAPWRLATSVSASSSERGTSRCPALIARTTPPVPSTEAKTLNSADDVLIERERRRQRVGEDLHRRRLQLDLARGQVRVDVLLVAAHNLSDDADDVLAAQPLGGGEQLGAFSG